MMIRAKRSGHMPVAAGDDAFLVKMLDSDASQ
jgi:hypothetical protein